MIDPADSSLCSCGSGLNWWREYDARGIYIGRMCERCMKEKLKSFRPEVLSNPNYVADEPIDPEE